MSIKGFYINGSVQKYDYNSLDNIDGSTGLTEQAKRALLACFEQVAWTVSDGKSYYDALEEALYPQGYVDVTNNLTGCRSTNEAITAAVGKPYTATIIADSGYSLTGAEVSITMGGESVTGYYSSGTISIPNVTGDIVITVAATSAVSSISAVYTQSGTVYATDTLDSLKADLVVTAHYSDSSTQTVPAANYTLSGTLAVGTSTITVSYGGQTDTFDVTVSNARNWLYHFNESLASSGNEDFNFTGVAEYTTGVGDQGYAYYHHIATEGDSSTDPGCIYAINLSVIPDLSGDFTISAWHKCTTSKKGYIFYATKSTSGSYPVQSVTIIGKKSGWSISQNSTSSSGSYRGVRLAYINDTLLIEMFTTANKKRTFYITAPTSANLTAWHHHAVTRSGNTIRYFFDGEIIFSFESTDNFVVADQIAVCGAFSSETGSTAVNNASHGSIVDDLYIAEFCKWNANFDATAITY